MSEPTPPASSTYELYPPVEIGAAEEPAPRAWINWLLLAGTVLTMLVSGARMNHNFAEGLPTFWLTDGGMKLFPVTWIWHNPAELLNGIPFALALIFILLCHEMGHYLYCLYYGVDATLPFFIPFPSPIGTLGAFIRIRSRIRSRSALFDIGIAGPIAGFVASFAVLIFALPLSHVSEAGSEMGLPLVFSLIFAVLGKFGIGVAAKAGLEHVTLHPAAVAAWVGMFATSLNLLPGGQLDGGHIIYALTPRGHKWISRISIAALIGMTYFWIGWGLWALLLRLSGKRHPQVAPWPDITRARKYLALFALLMLILTFVPEPLPGVGVRNYVMEFVRR
jgi:membrane-associated protease RseP (regulator of RpoE activity)